MCWWMFLSRTECTYFRPHLEHYYFLGEWTLLRKAVTLKAILQNRTLLFTANSSVRFIYDKINTLASLAGLDDKAE